MTDSYTEKKAGLSVGEMRGGIAKTHMWQRGEPESSGWAEGQPRLVNPSRTAYLVSSAML